MAGKAVGASKYDKQRISSTRMHQEYNSTQGEIRILSMLSAVNCHLSMLPVINHQTATRQPPVPGSVMRVLVMWVWTAEHPCQVGPAPAPPAMVS
jgi:hypothetical protein